MSPYSTMIFHNEINDRTPLEIEVLIKEGTKVFFFTYDPVDDLKDNVFLKKAMKEQMLFLYEVRFHEELDDDLRFDNGEAPERIMTLLVEQTTYFNDEQFRVEHAPPDENIIVSAGAGTGKTTVMINRILYLKYKQPDLHFSQIGLVTFTNIAANNMREKLIQKLKTYFYFTKDLKYLNWLQELKNMAIGTIHAFSESILKVNKDRLLASPDLHLTSFKYKRRKIIEEVIDEFNIQHPQTFSRFKYIEQYRIVQSVEMIIDQIMNHSISVDKLLTMNFGEAEDGSNQLYDYVVKETCKRLNEHKKMMHAMDVFDLIIAMDEMMQSEETFLMPYKYIFIDEFQDTDRIQTKFFAYIANTYPVNLFVVGDVKQSVYRFRGADYTAFQQLKSQTTVKYEYYLQHNYRTDKVLLDSFNHLFSVWPQYVSAFNYEKEDQLMNGFEAENEVEHSFIIKRFETTSGRVNYLRELENTDTAVLLRTNKEINELSRLCEENSIFFTSEQDGDFYRSVPVREFYQLVKRFTHPNNWKNRYLLHISSYGDRNLEISKLLSNFTPDRSFHALLSDADPKYEQYEASFQQKSLFEIFQEIITTVNPANVYANRYIANKTKTKKNVKQGEILKQEYQMNLDQLIYQLKLEFGNTMPSLYRLEKVLRMKMQTDKTMSTLYKQDLEMDRLSLMTVHNAKGLEFDQVFLPSTDKAFVSSLLTDIIIEGDSIGYHVNIGKDRIYQNNIYGDLRNKERIENIGEEARLLYVALTRAKKTVIVDAPTQTNNYSVRNWGDLIAKGISESADIQQVLSY